MQLNEYGIISSKLQINADIVDAGELYFGFDSAGINGDTSAGFRSSSGIIQVKNKLSSWAGIAPLASPSFSGTVSGITASMIGLSNVTNVAQLPLSYLDTDITLSANSDVKVPSQKAIKSYVDGVTSHTQNTDTGTTNATFTIDADDNAVGYVNLTLKNGINSRTIRVNKSTNDLELQKIDGSYIALATILTQNGGVSKYVHIQSSAVTIWTINHNMNSNDILINVWDDNGFLLISDVSIITPNQVSINFVNPQSGRAIIIT